MPISPLLPAGDVLMFALVAFTVNVKAKTLMKVHLNVSNVLSARVCQGTPARICIPWPREHTEKRSLTAALRIHLLNGTNSDVEGFFIVIRDSFIYINMLFVCYIKATCELFNASFNIVD